MLTNKSSIGLGLCVGIGCVLEVVSLFIYFMLVVFVFTDFVVSVVGNTISLNDH